MKRHFSRYIEWQEKRRKRRNKTEETFARNTLWLRDSTIRIEKILEREPDIVAQKKRDTNYTTPKETKYTSYDNNINVPRL